MGQSDAPDLGYGMPTYAADLAALLDALGVDEVVLCGLSMGGYVAFEFLRRWRDRVRGLMLMDTRAEADTPMARRARDARPRKRGSAGRRRWPRPCSPRCSLPEHDRARARAGARRPPDDGRDAGGRHRRRPGGHARPA